MCMEKAALGVYFTPVSRFTPIESNESTNQKKTFGNMTGRKIGA